MHGRWQCCSVPPGLLSIMLAGGYERGIGGEGLASHWSMPLSVNVSRDQPERAKEYLPLDAESDSINVRLASVDSTQTAYLSVSIKSRDFMEFETLAWWFRSSSPGTTRSLVTRRATDISRCSGHSVEVLGLEQANISCAIRFAVRSYLLLSRYPPHGRSSLQPAR